MKTISLDVADCILEECQLIVDLRKVDQWSKDKQAAALEKASELKDSLRRELLGRKANERFKE